MASGNKSSADDGMLWETWVRDRGLNLKRSEPVENRESDSMKLQKEDMKLFGSCPDWEDFFLVVCNVCELVVKPQSLKSHIELKHSDIVFTKGGRTESTFHNSKSAANKTTSSSTSSSSSVPRKTATSKGTKSSSGGKKTSSNSQSGASTYSASNSVKRTKAETKLKDNTMAPVVRVERISESTVKDSISPSGPVLSQEKELPSPQQPPPPPSLPSTPIISLLTVAPVPEREAAAPDKEYNPNTHCGVLTDKCKPCTKSLTCKVHPMSSKRAVIGRKLPLDTLLLEHKAAKSKQKYFQEKDVQPLVKSNGQTALLNPPLSEHSSAPPTCTTTMTNVMKVSVDTSTTNYHSKMLTEERIDSIIPKVSEKLKVPVHTTVSVQITSTKPSISSTKSSVSSTKPSISSTKPNISSTKPNISSTKPSISSTKPSIPSTKPSISSTKPTISVSSDSQLNRMQLETVDIPPRPHPLPLEHRRKKKPATSDSLNSSYTSPRPQAVCTFGLRRLTSGMLTCERNMDTTRSFLNAALCAERLQNHQPIKKLCTESRFSLKVHPVNMSCDSTSLESTITTTALQTSEVSTHEKISAAAAGLQAHTVVTSVVKPRTVPDSSTHSHKELQSKAARSKTKSVTKKDRDRNLLNMNIPNGTNVSTVSVLSMPECTNNEVAAHSQSMQITMPFSYSDIDTLSRLQAATPSALTLPQYENYSPFTALPHSVMSNDGSLIMTGYNSALNKPVISDPLHSVNVGNLSLSSGGLGITLGAAGLVSQYSDNHNCVLPEDLSCQTSSNKSHARSSILSNNHDFTSGKSWSQKKYKMQRKSGVTNSIIQKSHDNTLSNFLQLSVHGNSPSNLNSNLSPHSVHFSEGTSQLLNPGSCSPCVPLSSPLHNGLGPSSPPYYTPDAIIISGTVDDSQPLCLSSMSQNSSSVPTDLSSGSTGSVQKGKSSNNPYLPSLPTTTTFTTGSNAVQLSLSSFSMEDIENAEILSPVSMDEQSDSHSILDIQVCQPKPRLTSKSDKTNEVASNLNHSSVTLPLKMPLLMPTLSSTKRFLQLPAELLLKNGILSTDPTLSLH